MISGLKTRIIIGTLEVLRCPDLWIESERHKPLSRTEVALPDPTGEFFKTIAKKDSVSVTFGYRGQSVAKWEGTVALVKQGKVRDQIIVGAVGLELPLTATRVTQAWENETPEAIITWAINQAGLIPGQIESTGVIFPRFIASDIPVWQVARQCEHTCKKAFGLDMKQWALWMGQDGSINWGSFDEPGDIPVIATGKNLIKHSPAENSGGLSVVETFLVPDMRHSRKFHLTDTRRGIDQEFRAIKVRHSIQDTRIRSHFWYGEEYERY